MKTFNKLVIALSMLIPLSNLSAQQKTDKYKLWYKQSANESKWSSEALPLGNGKLGCMIFGGTAEEHIQFNVDTLWVGDEQHTGAYQNFGDIFINFGEDVQATDYRRELDISRAVETVTYTSGGIHYKREYFISYPAKVLAVHFTADKPDAFKNVKISLNDAHKAQTEAEKTDTLIIKGNLKGYSFKNKQKKPLKVILDYEARLKVIPSNGTVTAAAGGILTISGSNDFTLYLAADTDFLNDSSKGWKGELPHERLMQQISSASTRKASSLMTEHINDYMPLFKRFTINLGQTAPDIMALPTDKRLAKYKEGGKDPELELLMCQYARYLVISATRYGLPSNLQGIWNNSNNPPWRCDFHSDVNIEMNYWLVDQTNLSDCFQPFADWLMSIREVRKRETAKAFKTRGWITHGENGAFGGSSWRWSKGDSAWMLQCMWSHYQYTLDKKFLKEYAYPLMTDVCEFWVDNLKALPNGKLVSPKGYSPEHGPTEDGVSFDQQLVWNLFDDYLKASNELGIQNELTEKIAADQKRLLGPQVGSWGQLMEWMVDRDKKKERHRHLSHMIAVHPGHQISPLTTPELAKAAEVSMNARGDGSTGWSKAWKINIWARLHDGNRAYKLLGEFIKYNVYNNLFGFHPPFQIDCNFGYASGVCEMLLQSHMGFIQLLPALPDAWPEGFVHGIKARNAFILDIEWKNLKLKEAKILSQKGKLCRIYTTTPYRVTCNGKEVEVTKEENNIISFRTEAGKTYKVQPAK